MNDEGFHEVQLSGKQLVFLFMAATVVLVVIFLCGVLVGRGVRAGRSADLAAIADPSQAQPQIEQPAVSPSESSAPAGEPAAQSGAVVGADELSYYKRLESENQQTDKLKPDTVTAPPAQAADVPSAAAAAQAASGAAASATVESPKPAPAKTQTAAAQKRLPQAAKTDAAVTPASQDGLVVQVAALRDRAEAEAVVKQLAAKGYPAFLVDPTPGSPTVVYRVRVGRYKDRREAEQIVRRLEKEEQFKPWITR